MPLFTFYTKMRH